jgi:hypothetical protein
MYSSITQPQDYSSKNLKTTEKGGHGALTQPLGDDAYKTQHLGEQGTTHIVCS